MNKKVKLLLQFIIFAGLGIGFIYWSVHGLTQEQVTEIFSAIKNSRLGLLVPVFLVLLASNIFRALRWKIMLQSLGYTPPATVLTYSIMIGLMANQALPRVGEVLKCTLVSRYTNIPFSKLVGSIISERLFDLLCLLSIIAITISIQPELLHHLKFNFNKAGAAEPGNETSSNIFAVIIAATIVIVLIIGLLKTKKTPRQLLAGVRTFFSKFLEGLSSIFLVKNKWLFALYTLGIWGSYYLAGYLGFYGMEATTVYGFKEALSLLAAGSLGIALTPGGIGAYQFLIQKTMELYGLATTTAIAFSWLLWISFTLSTLLGGFISLILLPFQVKKPNGNNNLTHS